LNKPWKLGTAGGVSGERKKIKEKKGEETTCSGNDERWAFGKTVLGNWSVEVVTGEW